MYQNVIALQDVPEETAKFIVDLENQFIQAWQLDDKGAKEEAYNQLIAASEQALSQFPESAELMSILANAKIELADVWSSPKSFPVLKEGRALLLKAIEKKPLALDGFAEATLGGVTFFSPGKPFSFGDKKAGVAIFEEALEQKPDSAELLYQYANVLMRHKQKPRAKELYEKALKHLNDEPQQGRDLFRDCREACITKALAKFK